MDKNNLQKSEKLSSHYLSKIIGEAIQLALDDEKVLSFKKNKTGNGKFKALGLEAFDPPLSQFLVGGSGPHCLSFQLILE